MVNKARSDARRTQPPDPPDKAVLLAGRYELRDVLGRGSMGTVYRGQDVVLDRPVAVKLFPNDASDAPHAARYEHEARLLARLSHPGLVTVFDVGIDASVAEDPKPYLVMEIVHGQTLSDRIRRGRMQPGEVATLVSELSSALGYIHRRGVVHRDIKPANILLAAPDEPGEPESAKLTDFGIARLVDGTRITMTGFTLGTANYLSPEQLKGGDVAAPSDMYSLGLVVLECLTGEVAYPGHGAEAALARLHRPPEIPDWVPEGWTRLLRSMTDDRPSARPTAADVGVAVTGLAADAAPTTPARPAPSDDATVAMAPADPPDDPTVAMSAAEPPDAPDDAPDGMPPPTRLLPAVGGPVRAPARRRVRPWAWVAAALAVVLIVIVLVVATSGDTANAPSTPTYPSVPGRLGTHLHQLQQDVGP